MKLISIMTCLLLTGCTYSVTMAHTQGTATDVVDETSSNTPSTSISVPVSLSPKPVI